MTRFDPRRLKTLIDSYVIKKVSFCGEVINKRQQMYEIIGNKVHQSGETVRGWTKARSSGPDPRDPEALKRLEECLGVRKGYFFKAVDDFNVAGIVEKEDNKMNAKTTSDFQKMMIWDCYQKMRKFVSDMELEEERYYELRNVIEEKKMVLPDTVYEALVSFLDETVEPYVYAERNAVFTPEEAEYNEEGTLELKTEAAAKKLLAQFAESLLRLDSQIQCFAERELKPYLEA